MSLSIQMVPQSVRARLAKLRFTGLNLLVHQQEMGSLMIEIVLSLLVGSGTALVMYMKRRRFNRANSLL
jgi:hypothetical protein